jgi:hypothetical protein
MLEFMYDDDEQFEIDHNTTYDGPESYLYSTLEEDQDPLVWVG